MRTTIEIDDELIDKARQLSDTKSKKAIVETALREFINARRRQQLIDMIGKVELDMTLEDLRKLRGCDRADDSS